MDARTTIEQQIQTHAVVLYMKGSPDFPQCGFSANAVRLLRAAGAQDIFAVDVLQDPAIRQGIKEFSNWPTIPQLYVRGEFIGGSDILTEMHQNGELAALIKPAA